MSVRPRAPEAVGAIVQQLEEAGFPTWAVGGAVRDAYLGVESGDWDLASRATPKEVMRLFRRTIPVGVDHGTVGVFGSDSVLYEVTTFRRDVETFGRHAVVEFADTLEEDLSRRDYTLNAIAWHPLRGDVVDPFDGIADLRSGVLRAVGVAADRFREDFLRILRGIRFAGRFGLDVEEQTWRAMCDLSEGLQGLSAERVREELMKVMEQDAAPSAAFALYSGSGALGRILPDLAQLASNAPELWAQVLTACDSVSQDRPLLRLALIASPMMEEVPPAEGAAKIRKTLEELRFSNAEARTISHTLAAASAPPGPGPECTDADARRWLARHGTEALNDVIRFWVARFRAGIDDGVDLRTISSLRRAAASGAPLSVGDIAFAGGDLIRLGYTPGPAFREVLERLLDVVLESPELNSTERLTEIAAELLGPSQGQGS